MTKVWFLLNWIYFVKKKNGRDKGQLDNFLPIGFILNIVENIHSFVWGLQNNVFKIWELSILWYRVILWSSNIKEANEEDICQRIYAPLCGIMPPKNQFLQFCISLFLFLYFSTLCLETANSYLIHEAAKEADEAPGSPCNSSTDHLNGNDHHDHYWSLLWSIIITWFSNANMRPIWHRS